jgi:integrase
VVEQTMPIPAPIDRKDLGHVLRGLAGLADLSALLLDVPDELKDQLRNLRSALPPMGAQKSGTSAPTYQGYKSTYPEYSALGRPAPDGDLEQGYRLAQLALVASLAVRPEMAADDAFLDSRCKAGLACRQAASNKRLRERIDEAANQVPSLSLFGQRLREEAQAYKVAKPLDVVVPRHLDAIARLLEYAFQTKRPLTRPPSAPRERKIGLVGSDDDTQIEADILVDRRNDMLVESRKAAGAAPTGEAATIRQGSIAHDCCRESRGKSTKQRFLQASYLSRSISTQNQHLPAASDRLQLHDLQVLLEWLRSASNRKGLAAAQEQQAKELTAMSLIFGASIEALLTVRAVATETEIDLAEAGNPWLVLQGGYVMVRRPALPDAFIPDSTEATLYEAVDDWQIWPFIETFPGLDSAIARARANPRGHLFAGNAQQWRSTIQPALSKLNLGYQSRLTPARIASFLRRFVADLTGDVATATLCTVGGIGDDCAARLYYFAPFREDIRHCYINAIDQLHRAIVRGQMASQGRPTPPPLGGRVGSQSYPQEGEVIKAVAALARSVPKLGKGRPSERQLVAIHNQLVAYTVTMVQWSTGARAVKDPIDIALTDLVEGLIVLSDKDGDSYAETRIAWLPELAREQLLAYSVHREQLAAHKRFGDLVRSAPSWLFFIVGGRASLVTPALLEEFRGDQYRFRGNAQRHYLRTKLAELGTAGNLIDALLGHGAFGESAYGRFSCFMPKDLKAVVTPQVGELLERLGWQVLPGLPPPRRLAKGKRRPSLPQAPPSETSGIGARAANRGKAAAVRARRKKEIIDNVRSSIWRYFKTFQSGGAPPPVMQFEALQKLLPAYELPWERRHLNVVTTEILKFGEEQGLWTVETLPPQVVRLRRDPSPFRPSRITSTRIVHEIHRRHIDQTHFLAIRADCEDEKERNRRLRIRAGQLLVSAILDSGLVAKPFVDALPAALAGGMHEYNGRIWIDFSHSPSKPDDLFGAPTWIRRWFPTRITASLLLRWKLDCLVWPSPNGMSLDAILKTYFAELGVHFDEPGKSKESHVRFDHGEHLPVETSSPLAMLLQGGRTSLYTRIPRLLADFASDPSAGCSMDARSWGRVISGRALNVDAATIDASRRRRAKNEPDSTSRPDDDLVRNSDQQSIYRRILHCLRGPQGYVKRPQARSELEALVPLIDIEQAPLLRKLAEWTLWCLTARDIGNGLLKVSSTYQYLRAVAWPLLLSGAHLNAGQVRGEDECEALIAAYDEAAESISSSQARQYASQRIAEFHFFLTRQFGTPPIKWRGYNTYTKQKPNANLVTESEFAAIRRSVDSSNYSDRRKKLLHLLLIFGYRLGLRRDEIAARQLNCLQGFPWSMDSSPSLRPQLWIHAVHRGSIKRRASNRRLPLAHLLTREELDLLFSWAKLRASEMGDTRTGTERLFAAAPGATAKLADSDGFSEVSKLIRDVTGDDTLDFHHLRHSFVSLHTARILWPTDVPPLGQDEFTSLLPPEKLDGKKLIHNLMLSKTPPRATMYQIAALAGHIDPQETVGTYCHTLDLLLERYLDQEAHSLTARQAHHFLGRSDGAQRIARHREKPAVSDLGHTEPLASGEQASPLQAAYSALIEKARRKKLFLPLPELRPITERPLQDEGSNTEDFPSLLSVYRLLRSAGLKETLEQRADAASIPMDLAKPLLQSARRFAREMTTAFRDPTRRRSRATLKRDNHANTGVDHRQLPETAGLARAIPKPPHERKEAEAVYARLVESMLGVELCLADAITVFNTSSRSSPHLIVKTRKQFESLERVLQAAGIGRARLAVEIQAIGLNETSKVAATRAGRAMKLPGKQVTVAIRPRIRRRGAEVGPLNVRVLQMTSQQARLQARNPGASLKAAYGWRVGLFYALVCCTAVSERRAKSSYTQAL